MRRRVLSIRATSLMLCVWCNLRGLTSQDPMGAMFSVFHTQARRSDLSALGTRYRGIGTWGEKARVPCAASATVPVPSPAVPSDSASLSATTEAVLTALVAGCAIGTISTLNRISVSSFGLPLWAPPLGAVALIFAKDSVTAAKEGKCMAIAPIRKNASRIGIAVAGACLLAVFSSTFPCALSLRRGVVVAIAALWMQFFKGSAFFPPTGAFCVLWMDQVAAKGPLSSLGYTYALFPCALGTVLLLLLCRAYSALAVGPTRKKAAIDK